MILAERIFRRKDFAETSKYGWRVHPVTKVRSFHYGIDYGTKGEKWEQFALEKGIVVSAGIDSSGAGAIFAWVEYPRLNIRLLHYHLDKVFVRKGQSVNENTVIGLTGTTGRSTGIHLHLGVKRKINGSWVYIDPATVDYKPFTSELADNGVWDIETTKALQKRFNTVVDGVISGQTIMYYNIAVHGMKSGWFGSQLIRAIQKWLGISVNGKLNQPTIKALQKRLGTIQDGVISSNSLMVRELKKRLRENTL